MAGLFSHLFRVENGLNSHATSSDEVRPTFDVAFAPDFDPAAGEAQEFERRRFFGRATPAGGRGFSQRVARRGATYLRW